MCLVSNSLEPSISTYNIECYKILIRVNGKYITPYRNFEVSFNSIMEDTAEEHYTDVFGVRLIESGYFNACLNKEGISHVIQELKKKLPKGTTVKIFKAQVPEGTQFYFGQQNDICAKKLIIYEDN